MKLVRDKMPEIMLNEGKSVEIREAHGREYEFMLLRTLQEKTDDFIRDRSSLNLAELEDVLRTVAKLRGIRQDEVEKMIERKTFEMGGFEKKIILEEVKCETKQ